MLSLLTALDGREVFSFCHGGAFITFYLHDVLLLFLHNEAAFCI